MRSSNIALALLFALFSAEQTCAQSGPPPAGTRIRLWTLDTGGNGATRDGGNPIIGRLDRVGNDSLWLRLNSADAPLLAIDRAAIQRLELSDGRERNPGEGALLGAAAGLGLGLLAVATLDDCTVSTRGWSFDLCANNEDFLILGNVMAGAAAGAFIGLLITTERWAAVPQASLRPLAARHGVGLRFRLRLPK